MSAIAIFGELNLDLIVTGPQGLPEPGREKIVERMELTLGGSSAILAAQLARLDDDVLFVAKTGSDDLGKQALSMLRATGVPSDWVIVDDSLPSGLTISIAVDGERAMLTQLGCIEELRWEDLDFGLLQGRRHLHISAFYLQRNLRPHVGRIFARAREIGLTTSLDTGWPTEGEPNGELADVWPHLDVFLPNEAEATYLTGCETVEQALSSLSARGVLAVVKLGPGGAVAQRDDRVVRQPAFDIDVLETTGAGDSFNGGFLHGYLAGWDLDRSLDLGNACGALSTRAAGGTTTQPTLQEALDFIRTAPRRSPG